MSPRTKISFVLSAALLTLVSVADAQTKIKDRYFDTSDGVQLHYTESGKGRTLVFIPGWTMPAEIWEPQIEYFSKEYRVIAFDPRSQGKSDIAPSGHALGRRADDIKELLVCSRSKSAVLIGWSLGVSEVLTYLKQYGDKGIEGVVLVDNALVDLPSATLPKWLNRFKENRKLAADTFVRSMYKTPQSEDYIQKIVAESMKTPYEPAASLLMTSFPKEVWDEIISSLKLPVLFVSTPRYADDGINLKKMKPWVWTEVFTKAGHALFVDEADRFNKLLEQFLSAETWKKGKVRH